MFFELIAAIVAAVAAGGAVMLLNRMTGGRLPRWLVPAAAGLAMILFSIRMEYTWFERTTGEFPEGIVVTEVHEASSFWRPWTYAAPLVDRFVAVETAAIRSNEAVPHQRMADLMFFGRWQAPRSVPMVFDCAAGRSAPLFDTVTFDETGAVEDAAWATVADDDPTFETICKEARS